MTCVPPPFQSILNTTAKTWEIFKKISEDKTKRIGDRIINGIPAIGFSIEELPPKKLNFPDNSTEIILTILSGELWVTSSNGTPIEAEINQKIMINNNEGKMIIKYTDIQWDVPLADDLFNPEVPEGWQLSRTQIKTIDYKENKLAPGITLRIYTIDHNWEIIDEDVATIIQAVETTYPNSNKLRDVKVTIELNKEAAQYLYENVNATREGFLTGDFNNELSIVVKHNKDNPNRLTFDLSGLYLSLSNIEKRYFTETSLKD
ncbi:MAG: hypothetical protein JW927_09150 [Deltaproteobacteria bacterium]|nr:hypothetical protein [Deltaproteobacteria bacterium]